MNVTFLGTSCMMPTAARNTAATLLGFKNESILIDCGEGTQRQLRHAGIRPTKLTRILISHWHGDHVLGLPGLIQTLGMSEYTKQLEIYGPRGTKEYLKKMLDTFVFDNKVDIKAKDISKKRFYDGKEFALEALPLEHGIPCLGFSFVEKDRRKIKPSILKQGTIPKGPLLGKLQKGESIVYKGKRIKPEDATTVVKGRKVTYIADTLFCENCITLADHADLLISEAVYDSSLQEKAREYKHLTAQQSAQIAAKAEVKRLVLTHFSQRYKDVEPLVKEAKMIFPKTSAAEDFTKLTI